MIINATNNTDAIISLSDINLIPRISVDLLSFFEIHELQKNDQLFVLISTNKLIINDGINDLSILNAYKFIMNHSLAPTDRSGRPRIHQTSRPEGSVTCWSSVGDNISDSDSGLYKGVPAIINHKINRSDTPIYIDFNTIDNITYLHEGSLSYINCNFDIVYCQIVPMLTQITPSSNTNFKSHNGIIIPAAGDGDILIDLKLVSQCNGGLVQVKYDERGIKTSAGFWNASWNNVLHKFENIVATPDGSGDFNLFYYEMIFSTFVVDHLLGTGNFTYQSSDIDRLWHGMRIKISSSTCGYNWMFDDIIDHDWQAAVKFTMHREKLA